MSSSPYSWIHGFEPTPAERYFNRVINERPYWVGHQNPLSMANAVGNVVDDESFIVSVDVSMFAPHELSVAVVGGELLIEGSHEEKDAEHGRMERHFLRKYPLPKECHVDSIASQLSREGVLTVVAPKRNIAIEMPRTVPIMHGL